MSPGEVVIVSWPPATVYSLGTSRTMASQRVLSRLEPSNPSLKPPPVPPPPDAESGLNRIQSKCATGKDGAWSDSATGPIRGLVNVARDAGLPTGRNSAPSNE